MRSHPVLPALLAAAYLSLAPSAPAHADGNVERGRQLAYTCYGCHGIDDYKNVYPTYSVPKLEGQNAEYLAVALAAYKSGERAHATMHSQAASMTVQDMQDIATFLAGASVLKPDPKTVPEGKLPQKAEQLCVACHGADGVGTVALYPTIAGQHADYLERTLLDYKSGARKNPVMAGLVTDLNDAQIRELAAYYARQKPSLSTAEHAMWFAEK